MTIKIVQTDRELQDAYHVREIVFIHEQHVSPELEMDEHDQSATHFVGYVKGEPLAASRLRYVDEYGKLERICVLQEHRGKHYGNQIIEAMEEEIKRNSYQKAKLNAQTHAEGFYKALGYETISDEFMDAGIPHVTMVKTL
ncbi:GNAT family N-acetyltransferase [Salinibacillus xinjiangensis]|uniref:GNAT family N-acetyltransferase n=1 Tax=Salinibacillus xinjiangensis TaxID=1229268 RepID=A0A6G1X7X3_9BACI|nr:GNAT family N-acetyltransferase [Salinibacillus xinjiangensis]MRG87103.1 GNAT family N-acetyltransferase [Salinibacillus xinjiangensis]